MSSVGKDNTCTGNNPLVFGPEGCNIYNRRIVERKDRPGTFRIHEKYQTQNHHKVRNIKINLGTHVRFPVLITVFVIVFLHTVLSASDAGK